jgi:mersacidin/lichenicidin family type 2 lantibiotic
MTREQIVTAWKNTDYRHQLTTDDREALPAHPAGESALSDSELAAAVGASTCHCLTLACCGGFTEDPGYCSFACWSIQEFCTMAGCS